MLKIKELREELYLTQVQLAEKLNTSQRNVSNWENGSTEPDCATIVKIADFFEVSLDELFGRTPRVNISAAEKEIFNQIRKLNKEQTKMLLSFLKTL